MKRITCELCGSNEFVKEDGMFVCQSCGTKYTVEEAKKMMIEGTVNVSGTVQINREQELQNRFQNGLNEFRAGNFERASSLFTELLNLAPQNSEAIIYKAVSDAYGATLENSGLPKCAEELCRACELAKEKGPEEYGKTAALAGTEFYALMDSTLKALGSKLNRYNALIDEAVRNYNNVLAEQKSHRWTNNLNDNIAYSNAAKQWAAQAQKMDNEKREWAKNAMYPITVSGFKFIERIIGHVDKDNMVLDESMFVPLLQMSGLIEGLEAIDEANAAIGRNLGDKVMNKINEVKAHKQDILKKKGDAYWAEHQEERQVLEAELTQYKEAIKEIDEELKALQKKATELKTEGKKTPLEEKRDQIEKQIRELEERRGALGLFKGKEKKQIADEIETLYTQKPDQIDIKEEKQKLELENTKKLKPIEQQIEELNSKRSVMNEKLEEVNKVLLEGRG